jgi:VanZ family protein
MAKVEHKPTQNERIIEYIQKFGSITQLQALQDLGIMRLASRISDLKRLGYPIESKMQTVKNRFEEECHIKVYFLKGSSNAD